MRSARVVALLAFSFVATLGVTSEARAWEWYKDYVPNGAAMFSAMGGTSNVFCGGQNRTGGSGCLMCHQTVFGGFASAAYCNNCPAGGASNPRCHNPFGLALFRGPDGALGTADDTTDFWDDWLARVDSDGDGWSNGQEMGDAFGRCEFSDVTYETTCLSGPLSYLSAPGGTGSGSVANEVSASYNVCSNGRSDCSANSACGDAFNDTGNYSCTCNSGYTGNGRTYTAGFSCTQSAGQNCYTLGTGTACTDINECVNNSDGCAANARCANSAGSFSCVSCGSNASVTGAPGNSEACVCNSGYGGSPPNCTDNNECVLNTDLCAAGSRCSNTAGGYSCTACGANASVIGAPSNNETCACNSGYGGTPPNCTDNNECVLNTDGCAATSRCSNSAGSFSCVACGANASVSGAPSNNETCVCNAGYSGSPGSCTDINECVLNTDGCVATSRCANSAGSFSCVACGANATVVGAPGGSETCVCNSGYGGSPPSCTDNNECLSNPCGVGGTTGGVHGNGCTNSPGSYTCACQAGYVFDGTTCSVSNPCIAGTHNCNTNATCTSLGMNMFSCACNAGWSGTGVGPSGCSNVNECANAANNNCDAPNATCTDTQGSYTCGCATGYVGNGVTQCTDVDECTNGVDPCGAASACTNIPGDYFCTPCVSNAHVTGAPSSETCVCDAGYSGTGSVSCTDNDECQIVPRLCPADAACGNSAGSYGCTTCGANAHVEGGPVERCVCNAGYAGDGFSCTDINECMGTFDCDANATCVNDVPGYHCTCNAGWQPDVVDPNRCVDTDECTLGTFTCDQNAHCVNDVASYHCVCNQGWEPSESDPDVCVDTDECNPANPEDAPCDENASCTNDVGSFTCMCNEHFMGDGMTCSDVNDCTFDNGSCPSGELCKNEFGQERTCHCQPGQTRSMPGSPCRSACGNGQIAAGESCDDGNVNDGDGCSARCRVERGYACYQPVAGMSTCAETCGDGFIEAPYETCDNGANNSDILPDACRVACVVAHCGDGVLDDGETCDDGDANSDEMPEACRSTCVPAYCGDGVIDPARGERCDNGHGALLTDDYCTTKRGCRRTVPAADAGVDAGGGSAGGGCAAGGAPKPSTWVTLGLLATMFLMRRARRS